MDLKKDILEQFTDETGNVVGPTDEQLEPYTFEKQKDDLTETLGSAGAVKKFFDFMAMRVFLPWARALTKRLNSFTDRVSGIEKDVIAPAEQATANAQNAAELASAAAETAMAKEQAGSILDVVTKRPLYFGTGDDETVAELAPVLPEQTLIFDPKDTSWDDLLKEVENKAPRALVDGTYDCATEEEIENVLKAVYVDMPIASMKHIEIKLYKGDQAFVHFDNGIVLFTLTKGVGKGENGIIEARNPQYYGAIVLRKNIFNSEWKEWEWVNPPMILGVEYKTTERCFGIPVYTKIIYFGILPSAGEASCPWNTDGNYMPIRVSGWTVKSHDGLARTLPYRTQYVDLMVSATQENVILHDNKGGSTSEQLDAYVQIWYVKGNWEDIL